MPLPQAPLDWPKTPTEAIALQEQLRSQVIRVDRLPEIHTVAGVDVGFEDEGRTTRAAVAVLNWPQLQLQTQAIARQPTCFPYIPGLLSFREIPTVLVALAQLPLLPDLLLCDGQGIAHPRRFGIACHLGVLLDCPTIGVAKSRLIGHHAEVSQARGDWQPLIDREEIIGAVLRTRPRTKPLYISTGHRISLERAIAYVMSCTPRYRLPETTRQAHRLASG
uniref:Endonuclease V n=1 Tax=Cyanothece sp. (strain PCC 7425 / ATCC 29141) TaxID=395961 RepID=B8HRY3_CYAP4